MLYGRAACTYKCQRFKNQSFKVNLVYLFLTAISAWIFKVPFCSTLLHLPPLSGSMKDWIHLISFHLTPQWQSILLDKMITCSLRFSLGEYSNVFLYFLLISSLVTNYRGRLTCAFPCRLPQTFSVTWHFLQKYKNSCPASLLFMGMVYCVRALILSCVLCSFITWNGPWR